MEPEDDLEVRRSRFPRVDQGDGTSRLLIASHRSRPVYEWPYGTKQPGPVSSGKIDLVLDPIKLEDRLLGAIRSIDIVNP
jgi:hypothetical protein